jgi:hypothetical protein
VAISARSRRSRSVVAGIELNSLRHSVPLEHRRLAGLHHMLWPAYGRGRVGRQHLAGNQPVEEHPHGHDVNTG